MAYYRTSRIIPIVLVVVIIIVAIAALVSLARLVFFSGNSTSSTTVVDTSQAALLNTADGHSVSMTVRGPIVADEDFHSYQIDISPSNRSLQTYTGYLEDVVDQVSLPNNVAAYEQFVNALDNANMADGKQFEGERNNLLGVCATGRIYEFAILNKGETVKMLWTSTCSGARGSLDASVNQLTSLFVAQIPDANDMINDIDL